MWTHQVLPHWRTLGSVAADFTLLISLYLIPALSFNHLALLER